MNRINRVYFIVGPIGTKSISLIYRIPVKDLLSVLKQEHFQKFKCPSSQQLSLILRFFQRFIHPTDLRKKPNICFKNEASGRHILS